MTSDSLREKPRRTRKPTGEPSLRGRNPPPCLLLQLDATVPLVFVFLLLSRRATNTRRRRRSRAHLALVVSGRRVPPTTAVATFPGRAHVLLVLGPDRSRFAVHPIERGGLARVVEAFKRRACCRILVMGGLFSRQQFHSLRPLGFMQSESARERSSPFSPRSLRAWKRPDECLTRAYSTCASRKRKGRHPKSSQSRPPPTAHGLVPLDATHPFMLSEAAETASLLDPRVVDKDCAARNGGFRQLKRGGHPKGVIGN